jgi:hypothetical protein
MKLSAYKPWMFGNFNHFDQIMVWVYPGHAKAGFLETGPESVVHFVAVAVPFIDGFGASVNLGGK